jgi:hypothetical protein
LIRDWGFCGSRLCIRGADANWLLGSIPQKTNRLTGFSFFCGKIYPVRFPTWKTDVG